MTREHLIEDIRNVIALGRDRSAPEDAERLRRAFAGLARHLESEHAPERVRACERERLNLGPGHRVLERHEGPVDEDTWSYALSCLEAALEFAQAEPASA